MKKKRKMRRTWDRPPVANPFRKKYRKGSKVGGSFIIVKEHLPWIHGSGKKKVRRFFVRCHICKNNYYLLKLPRALKPFKDADKVQCACFCDGVEKYRKTEDDVKAYSFHRELQKRKTLWRRRHPSWFEVTPMYIYVSGHVFYEFRDRADYVLAREIENKVWNAKTFLPKEFYMGMFSVKLDELHRAGKFHFYDQSWNRGAMPEYFTKWLEARGID